MEIMKSESDKDESAKDPAKDPKNEAKEEKEEKEAKENVFSDENLTKDSVIDGEKPIEISSRDKVAFVDAVVGNTRFTKDYALFGGKFKFTLRSLTSDEVNALATWTARQGTKDSAGLMAGKYRKYLLAAYVANLKGVEMPPLEEPLYEKIGSDGKTVEPPGWIKRCDFWDGIGYAQFQAILSCVGNFDIVYTTLCSKAEDSNFWNPDTP